MIENGRIRIYPASRDQMDTYIASETDEELKKAYSEVRVSGKRRDGRKRPQIHSL